MHLCSCVCMYEESYYKKLAHAIMESGKSKICRLDTQERQWHSSLPKAHNWGPGEATVQVKSKGSGLENSLLVKEAGLLVLLRSSTDLMRLIYIMEGNLLYPKFANLNVLISSKNTL